MKRSNRTRRAPQVFRVEDYPSDHERVVDEIDAQSEDLDDTREADEDMLDLCEPASDEDDAEMADFIVADDEDPQETRTAFAMLRAQLHSVEQQRRRRKLGEAVDDDDETECESLCEYDDDECSYDGYEYESETDEYDYYEEEYISSAEESDNDDDDSCACFQCDNEE